MDNIKLLTDEQLFEAEELFKEYKSFDMGNQRMLTAHDAIRALDEFWNKTFGLSREPIKPQEW